MRHQKKREKENWIVSGFMISFWPIKLIGHVSSLCIFTKEFIIVLNAILEIEGSCHSILRDNTCILGISVLQRIYIPNKER